MSRNVVAGHGWSRRVRRIERVTGIGGVFIRSAQPEQLRAWYAEHLGVEVEEWGGAVLDGVTWAIFDRDATVNYRVRDLDAMLAQLRAAGVRVDDQIEEMEFGRFGWAYDGDGNRIELWEPRSQDTSGSQPSTT
jgi:catechol 2,3-dioxygenase-like lactoylglutathione lyase family enzyme